MTTELGHNMIVWTVRVSVALYAIAVWRYLFVVRHQPSAGVDSTYRLAWSLSWLMCLIHIVCAYHFQHHWDQAAALKHTAELTERVVGLHWSGGLYVNYVFITMWGIDVGRNLIRTSRVSSVFIHSVAAFMMFNATVVFGPSWWWIPFALLVFVLVWETRSRAPKRASQQDARNNDQ